MRITHVENCEVFPEVAHVLEGLQEGLLDRILGVFAIVRDVFSNSQEFAIVSLHELFESRYISDLSGMDEIQIIPDNCLPNEVVPIPYSYCSRCFLKKQFWKTIHTAKTECRFRCTPSSSTAASLHHDLSRHLRVDRTKIGICSRLGKCVRELLVRIPHLGLEHTVCADHRVGNIITVGPDDRRSDRYRQRLRPKD